MPKAALLIAVSALLVAAACSSTPSPSGPPVGSLPDPAVFVTADALGALFADARLSEPACRYAQSNYRCIWTDTANSRRSLTVLVYADSQRVQQAIGGDGSRPVTIPGVSPGGGQHRQRRRDRLVGRRRARSGGHVRRRRSRRRGGARGSSHRFHRRAGAGRRELSLSRRTCPIAGSRRRRQADRVAVSEAARQQLPQRRRPGSGARPMRRRA